MSDSVRVNSGQPTIIIQNDIQGGGGGSGDGGGLFSGGGTMTKIVIILFIAAAVAAVSYTHLTLPTIYSV